MNVMVPLLNIESLLRQLVEQGERAEARELAKKEKKAPRDIETPEQWMARLRMEFKDIHDFDEQLVKCREYYRIKRKVCRRDTIEDWFFRQREYRTKNGIPEAPPAKKGLVL